MIGSILGTLHIIITLKLTDKSQTIVIFKFEVPV